MLRLDNHASVPIPVLRFRQRLNSSPRSKVIERRADKGRGDSRVIRRFIDCFELRSLWRNRTADVDVGTYIEFRLDRQWIKYRVKEAVADLITA